MLIKADVPRRYAFASTRIACITRSKLLVFSFLLLAAANIFAVDQIAVSHSLPHGKVASPYSARVNLSGGQAPYTFSLRSGALAPGLSLNSSTGLISGTPSSAGDFSFLVVVNDETGARGDAHLLLTIVNSGVGVTISPTSATVNSGASQQFSAWVTGTSNSAVHWSTTAGTIDASGLFVAPTVTANTDVAVAATSAADTSKSASSHVTVQAKSGTSPTITTTSVPAAIVGDPYSQALAATGGVPPYTWSYSGCPSAVGISCSSDGTISGTPATNGGTPFTIRVTVQDSAAHSSSPVSLVLRVNSYSGGCGPTATPPYPCSTHSTALAKWPATPNMGATIGVNNFAFPYNPATCSTSNPDFFCPTSGFGNGITRMTDANLCPTGAHTTASGGANEWVFDAASPPSFMSVTCMGGGGHTIVPLYYDANGFVKNGLKGFSAANTVVEGQHGAFSTTTPARFWSDKPNNGAAWLWRSDLTIASGNASTETAVVAATETPVFNWYNCPGLPSPFPHTTGAGMPVSQTESIISLGDKRINWGIADGAMGTSQGSSDWELVYDTTTGACTSLHFGAVGTRVHTVYGWCVGNCSKGGSNPAPLGTVQACTAPGDSIAGGMHNSNMFRDPAYLRFSAPCKPANGVQTQGASLWEIGTLNLFHYNGAPNGHNGNGYAAEYSCAPGSGYLSIASVSASIGNQSLQPSKYFTFPLAGFECHGSPAPFIASDTVPLLFASEGNKGIEHSKPLAEEVAAGIPVTGGVSRFGPTFSMWGLPGSDFSSVSGIGAPSQDGSLFCVSSNWEGTLGKTSTGTPRGDVFCYSNLQ